MDSPNVLLLDEPTNDFDVETLTALEDLLDSYGGTMLVISHDRYFLERTCDTFVGLLGDGKLRDLPKGVDQYLALRKEALAGQKSTNAVSSKSDAARSRELKKDLARLEKQLEKAQIEESALRISQEEHGNDHEKLIDIMKNLAKIHTRILEIEEEWLRASAQLEEMND